MIDDIVVPALLTVGGVAFLASLLTQWLKMYIHGDDEKAKLIVNGLCLGLSLTLAVLAQFIEAAWHPTASQVFNVALTAFVGASVATFGYEGIKNAGAWIGK